VFLVLDLMDLAVIPRMLEKFKRSRRIVGRFVRLLTYTNIERAMQIDITRPLKPYRYSEKTGQRGHLNLESFVSVLPLTTRIRKLILHGSECAGCISNVLPVPGRSHAV
jgi:hypothetical protein